MSELLQANIFFFIASIATIVFAILISIVLFYLLKIMQAVRRIVDKIEAESDMIAEDISNAREFVMDGGLVSYLFSFVLPKPKRRRTTKTTDVTSEPE